MDFFIKKNCVPLFWHFQLMGPINVNQLGLIIYNLPGFSAYWVNVFGLVYIYMVMIGWRSGWFGSSYCQLYGSVLGLCMSKDQVLFDSRLGEGWVDLRLVIFRFSEVWVISGSGFFQVLGQDWVSSGYKSSWSWVRMGLSLSRFCFFKLLYQFGLGYRFVQVKSAFAVTSFI